LAGQKEASIMKLEEVQTITEQLASHHAAGENDLPRDLLQSLGFEAGNIYQELEMTSRFVDTHQDITYSNSIMHLHSHTFYEILAVRSSGGAEYLVDAQRYKLQPGDIVIVPPGISHRPLLPDTMTEPYKRDVIWMSTEYLNGLLQLFPNNPGPQTISTRLIRTAGTPWAYLTDLIHRGVREAEQKRFGWELALAANTAQLLVHLCRAASDNSAKSLKAESKELMDNILEYVERHYAEKLTLSDIADKFYVSESTITLTFRKKMGVSFYHWVTQRRLIAAKNLIEGGQLLEEVAQAVGFSDYSSFFRAFKREFGISPKQYRNLL
jgi:AraC-like DNA-binding protein/mannose-6-phosphate isomerase-like protein (cupin superfamily)